MIDDTELLRRYADDGSEPAFAELVTRNIDLVYAAAFRHVGDEYRARDIAQTVFVDLARKSRSLRHHPALASWLFTSTRYAALKSLRSERRRQLREHEAHLMQQTSSSDSSPNWEQLRPLLDEVLHSLGESDREIVLMRYFRGLSFSDLSAQMRVGEGALRMRADRALGKMSGLLAKRGINSTAAALGLALSSQPIIAAPIGLVTSITGIATATAASLGGAGTLFLMSKTKIVLVTLLVAGGLTTAVVEHQRNRATEATLVDIKKDRAALSQRISDLSRLMAEAKAREAAAPATPRAAEPAAPVAKAAPVEPPPTPGVTRVAPAGWAKNGSKPKSYSVGVDQNQTWGGLPSAFVESLEPSVEGFGGMMQMSSPEDFAGKRVRFSGWVKTENANEGGGHLWLRVDGEAGKTLQIDNMTKRPVKGTTEWQQYSVVVDVPTGATALAYGFFVDGSGKMWVNGGKLEAVGPEIPSTNLIIGPVLPKTPTNLNFDPSRQN